MVEASALNKDAIRGMLFSLGFDGETTHQVIGALPARAIAILLYGSRARGDIHEHSDVDLLVVAEQFARTRAIGLVNTTTYAPEQIENAAGTLFGLHLARDGVVLHEHDAWLTDLLKRFEPTDPAQVLNRVRQLAVALRSDELSRTRYVSGLVRLARYLLRTAFYAKALDPGPPCFSISGLAERFCEPELTTLLSSHESVHGAASLDVLQDLERRIEGIIGPFGTNAYVSLQALIVGEWHQNRDLANAALLSLSSSRAELPYAEIPRIIL